MESRPPKRYFNVPKEKKEDLVYGIRPVQELLNSDRTAEKVLIQKDLKSEVLQEIASRAKELSVPVQLVPIEKLNRITRKNHQGVVAFVSSVVFYSIDNIIQDTFLEGRAPFILVLDRVTDIRNFGAIVRTASCAGVDAIVVPMRESAQIGSDAMKSSSGALHHVPICRATNLHDTIKYLKNSGLTTVACTEKASSSIYTQDLKEAVALIMGSEEEGISNDILKIADLQAKIPIYGKISSLNVSVAAGICLFEVAKQRHS